MSTKETFDFFSAIAEKLDIQIASRSLAELKDERTRFLAAINKAIERGDAKNAELFSQCVDYLDAAIHLKEEAL